MIDTSDQHQIAQLARQALYTNNQNFFNTLSHHQLGHCKIGTQPLLYVACSEGRVACVETLLGIEDIDVNETCEYVSV